MRSSGISIVLVATWFSTVLASAVVRADIEPGSLLIYYGWPSSINSTFSVPLAAAELGQYDYVVLGAGLEKVTHSDHTNTVNILADAAMAGTVVFGYIDVGVTTYNYSMTEIQTRVDEWIATGVDGIFFDDYGYDFGTTRGRQNDAVNYVHGQGLPVVANAFFVDDAFSFAVDATYNPAGLVTALGSGDFYLFESHQIRIGAYETGATWLAKAGPLATYRQSIGFQILSVTTNDVTNAYDADKFWYAWHSALIYGHKATGWSEYDFSAGTAQAPYRARPTRVCGTAFNGSVVDASPPVSRLTDQRNVVVNTTTHVYGCAVGSALPDATDDDGMTDAFENTHGLDPWTPPIRPRTRTTTASTTSVSSMP